MKTVRTVCWLLTIVALSLVFTPRVVVAQDEPTEDEVETASPDEAEAASRDGLDVEGMFEDDQDVFAGRGYGYDPAGRRDPFISLQRTRSDSVPDRGPRPDGVPGLLIGEVDLTGIFVLPEGPVAQVQTSDRDQSYLLRAGDKLYDGDVVSVSLNELVFRQILDDPTALTPFREVVKRLNP